MGCIGAYRYYWRSRNGRAGGIASAWGKAMPGAQLPLWLQVSIWDMGQGQSWAQLQVSIWDMGQGKAGHSYRLASGTWGKAKAGRLVSETWVKAKAGAQLQFQPCRLASETWSKAKAGAKYSFSQVSFWDMARAG